MKKIFYIPLLLLTMVIGVNKVSADTTLYFSRYYNYYEQTVDFYTNYSTAIDNLKSYYNNNWSNQYIGYVIWVYTRSSNNITEVALTPLTTDIVRLSTGNGHNYLCWNNSGQSIYDSYIFNVNNNTYEVRANSSTCNFNLMPFESSIPLTVNSGDVMQTPSYSNLELDVSFPQMNIKHGDMIPTYMSLTNGTPQADFTQVDMSDYEYIILSLKNYDTTTFNTTIYSLGRLCFTPVYNYGMTPKQEYSTGYQTQGCTEYYNTSTPVPIYIIQADLDNHAVYYIKRYENETNVLQIPTSIFDITYVTSQNANNPQVTIGGRSYPAIPYSDLTDTANISTNEGYVSGQVCTLGDINCQTNQSGMDISDLFTQPLKVLQSVWTSITSVFILIGEFIALIPSPLKEFLISAFMLSIILGILKIIL